MKNLKLEYFIILSILLTLLNYGMIAFIYIFTGLASFIMGFSICEFINPTILFAPCTHSTELAKITRQAVSENNSKTEPNKKITGCVSLDNKLNEIMDYIIRDYIDQWFDQVCTESQFPEKVRSLLQNVITNFSKRCQRVNWIPFLTHSLPDALASHMSLYRRSMDRVNDKKTSDINSCFFDLEAEMEGTVCRESICTNPEAEKDHLRQLCTVLMYMILPADDFKNTPLRYILRETIIRYAILPIMDHFTDPDVINQYVIQLVEKQSKGVAYTSEYFIQALRMSVTSDEILAVSDEVTRFETRLKRKDTGGDEGAMIKAQIGSLLYVKQVCSLQIKLIKAGTVNKPNPLFQLLQWDRLPDLSLAQVLSKDLALGSFLDFLCTIGTSHYLHMYLSLVAFRTTASRVPPIWPPAELSAIAQTLYSDMVYRSSEDRRIDQSQLAKASTFIKSNQLSPRLFVLFEQTMLKLLSEDRCFGAFKRSSFYLHTLTELDLLRDRVEDHIGLSDKDLFSKPTTSSTSPINSDKLIAAKVTGAEIQTDSVAVYTIIVTRQSPSGALHTWTTRRRFLQFDDFNNLIVDQFGKLPGVNFPPKKSPQFMNQTFAQQRVEELSDYLQKLLDGTILMKPLRDMFMDFLQPVNWEKPKLPSKGVSSLRTAVNSMAAVPNHLIEGVSRFLSSSITTRRSNLPGLNNHLQLSVDGGNAIPSKPHQSTSGNSSLNLSTQAEDFEIIPLRILFLLMEELFDLRKRNQIIRRGLIGILHRIVQAFFGTRVNKYILEKAYYLTSAAQMSVLASWFIHYCWPKGRPRTQATATSTNGQQSNKATLKDRDPATKMRTRVLCRTMMLGSISEELSQYLGSETTHFGVQRLFNMIQLRRLNRRLLHSLLASLLLRVFPENKLNDLLHRELCPAACTADGGKEGRGRHCSQCCGPLPKEMGRQEKSMKWQQMGRSRTMEC